MGDIQEKAVQIVSGAESGIRSLIAEAAQVGDYGQVNRLSEAAQKLVALRDGINSSTTRADESSGEPLTTKKRRTRKRKKAKSSGAGKRGYPRFEKRNGVLVKIGWSKKQRKAYVHKVPREAFQHTVSAIASLADKGGAILTAEDICERTEQEGQSVPMYQVYITLAFLRARGVLERQGREGYSAVKDVTHYGTQAWMEVARPQRPEIILS